MPNRVTIYEPIVPAASNVASVHLLAQFGYLALSLDLTKSGPREIKHLRSALYPYIAPLAHSRQHI